jgi:hypothetical protein
MTMFRAYVEDKEGAILAVIDIQDNHTPSIGYVLQEGVPARCRYEMEYRGITAKRYGSLNNHPSVRPGDTITIEPSVMGFIQITQEKDGTTET